MTEAPLRDAPAWVGAAASVIHRLPRGRCRATTWVGRYQTDPFWARMPEALGPLWFRCDRRDLTMQEVCVTGRDVRAALAPLSDVNNLGPWPHLLCELR